MKRVAFILAFLACAIWSYNIGHLDAPEPLADHRLDNMKQVQCDDIIGAHNAETGEYDTVCEVKIQSEDDTTFKIFKEN